jgi:hypothetical protein
VPTSENSFNRERSFDEPGLIPFMHIFILLRHVTKMGAPTHAVVYLAEFVLSSALRRIFASFTASSFAQKCI